MKKILLMLLAVSILSMGIIAYADETSTTTDATTTTATTEVTATTTETTVTTTTPEVTTPVVETETKAEEPVTVVKNVYGTKEGYIISFVDNQLIVSKDKVFTATFLTSAATKVSGVAANKKLTSLADLKAGQKVLVRFVSANKNVVSIKVLPGQASKAIKQRIAQKAKQISALKAKQKAINAKIQAAKLKAEVAAAKAKVAETKLNTEKEKVKEKVKSSKNK